MTCRCPRSGAGTAIAAAVQPTASARVGVAVQIATAERSCAFGLVNEALAGSDRALLPGWRSGIADNQALTVGTGGLWRTRPGQVS